MMFGRWAQPRLLFAVAVMVALVQPAAAFGSGGAGGGAGAGGSAGGGHVGGSVGGGAVGGGFGGGGLGGPAGNGGMGRGAVGGFGGFGMGRRNGSLRLPRGGQAYGVSQGRYRYPGGGGLNGGYGFGQNGDGLSDYAPYGRPLYGCDPTTPSRAHPGCY
jgi:hypothetical protein